MKSNQTPPYLVEAVSDYASRDPESVAISERGTITTYSELLCLLEQAEKEIQTHFDGIQGRKLVLIKGDTSAAFIATCLGAWKAGIAVVPISSDTHASSEEHIKASLGTHLHVDLDAETVQMQIQSDDCVSHAVDRAQDWAYICFTSGTTGRPKGVVVSHESLAQFCTADIRLRTAPGARTAALAITSFDASVFEIWSTLYFGGRIEILPRPSTELLAFLEAVESTKIDRLFLTTSLFHALLEARMLGFAATATVFVGGEVISSAAFDRCQLVYPDMQLYAVYGPTEAVVFTTIFDAKALPSARALSKSELAAVPLGWPLEHHDVIILDPEMVPCDPFEVGELFILGGLGAGYFNNAELTASAFVPSIKAIGTRMYRSGDLGYYDGNGCLHFIGRADNQVKIRGFRVEPEAVERAVLDHPEVAEAAVISSPGTSTSPTLHAFVMLARSHKTTRETEVIDWLIERLPDYMIPTSVCIINSMPRKPNGKIDRAALHIALQVEEKE